MVRPVEGEQSSDKRSRGQESNLEISSPDRPGNDGEEIDGQPEEKPIKNRSSRIIVISYSKPGGNPAIEEHLKLLIFYSLPRL